jgi:hypothetical protein
VYDGFTPEPEPDEDLALDDETKAKVRAAVAELGLAQLTEEQMEELVELCANVGWRATLLADGEPVPCHAGCGPTLAFSGPGRPMELTGDQTEDHEGAGLKGGLALVRRQSMSADEG